MYYCELDKHSYTILSIITQKVTYHQPYSLEYHYHLTNRRTHNILNINSLCIDVRLDPSSLFLMSMLLHLWTHRVERDLHVQQGRPWTFEERRCRAATVVACAIHFSA